MGILDTINQATTATWDAVQGGYTEWVSREVAEELGGPIDGSDLSAQPGAGQRTTGAEPPSDGSRGDSGSSGPMMIGGVEVTLQNAAAAVGILAGLVVVARYVRG